MWPEREGASEPSPPRGGGTLPLPPVRVALAPCKYITLHGLPDPPQSRGICGRGRPSAGRHPPVRASRNEGERKLACEKLGRRLPKRTPNLTRYPVDHARPQTGGTTLSRGYPPGVIHPLYSERCPPGCRYPPSGQYPPSKAPACPALSPLGGGAGSKIREDGIKTLNQLP